MKKFIVFICLLVVLIGCSNKQNEVVINEDDISSKKVLIVYFSATGNTKAVAEKISEKIQADLYEIVPKEPYSSDDLNYSNDNCRANQEMKDPDSRPEISGDIIDVSDYDVIMIGYPIWWSTMPRIINTFLDTYDLSGKVIMPFCTSGGSSINQSVTEIRNIEINAEVRDGLRIRNLQDDDIDNWLKENKLIME